LNALMSVCYMYQDVSKSFRTESITKQKQTHVEKQHKTKLTRLSHKIAIQKQLVAETCTICSSRSRRPVRKLLGRPSYDLTFVWSCTRGRKLFL